MKTFTNPGEIHPTSNAGEYVVHQQIPGQPWQLYLLRPDAADDEKYVQLSGMRHNVTVAGITEGVVVYVVQEADETGKLYRVPLDGSAAPELVRGVDGRPVAGLPYGGLKAGKRTAVAGFMSPDSSEDTDVEFYEIPDQSGAPARSIGVSPLAEVHEMWESGDARLAVIARRATEDPWRYHCQVAGLATGDDQHVGEASEEATLRKVGGEIPPTRDLHPAYRTAAISPDGEEFLYQREEGDWLRLYIRPVAGEEGELVATELNGEPGDLVGNWHPTDTNVVLITRLHGNQVSIYRLDRSSGECTPVPLPEGYQPHKIWHGDGQYSRPRFTSDGKVAILASSPTAGPHYVIADPDDPSALTLIDPLGGARPPGMPRRETALTISWTDDEPNPEHNVGTLEIPVRFIEPAGRERPKNGWRAIFLDDRGGPHLPDLVNRDLVDDALLECGYALVVPEYPGREGYGTKYREALLKDPGRVEARTFDAVCRYLQDNGFIDPGRTGYKGWSWGGRIGGLLAEYSHRFSAIVAGTPVVDQLANHDLTTVVQQRVIEHRHGGSPAEKPASYLRASAAACLPGENAPTREKTRYRLRAPNSSILYIPGKYDARCPDTTEEHCRRQRELGRDADRHQMPGGHFNDAVEEQVAVLEVTLRYFEEKLRSSRNPRTGARLLRHVSRSPSRPQFPGQRSGAVRHVKGRVAETPKARR